MGVDGIGTQYDRVVRRMLQERSLDPQSQAVGRERALGRRHLGRIGRGEGRRGGRREHDQGRRELQHGSNRFDGE